MEKLKLIFGTGLSASKDYEGLFRVVQAAIDSNIRCFDTAPSYGTEEILGRILNEIMRDKGMQREEISVQTKIDPWQMQKFNGEVGRYVEDALKKMKIDYIDSLLIHWPIPEYLDNTWKSFVRLYESGIVKKIGICNLRLRHLEKTVKYEFVPQIIQIERNPLMTFEKEVNFCISHGIEVQAYSPLCKMDKRIRDSVVLKDISKKHNRNIGQIVMRWHLDTGVVPVFTSTKPERIREYVGIFDFSLSGEEIRAISALNENYKMYLESYLCPGF